MHRNFLGKGGLISESFFHLPKNCQTTILSIFSLKNSLKIQISRFLKSVLKSLVSQNSSGKQPTTYFFPPWFLDGDLAHFLEDGSKVNFFLRYATFNFSIELIPSPVYSIQSGFFIYCFSSKNSQKRIIRWKQTFPWNKHWGVRTALK